jgi:hypothetical protein
LLTIRSARHRPGYISNHGPIPAGTSYNENDYDTAVADYEHNEGANNNNHNRVMRFNRVRIFQWQIASRIDFDVHLVQTLMCWPGDEPSKELDLHRTE